MANGAHTYPERMEYAQVFLKGCIAITQDEENRQGDRCQEAVLLLLCMAYFEGITVRPAVAGTQSAGNND